MFIQRVRVSNFRSLVDVTVDLTGYTALVGLNDAGKSNVLRALNLFFNDQTDLGQVLVFERDFSQNAKVGVKKARQIEIELELRPPAHYKNSQSVIWRKTYRSGVVGAHVDQIARKDGQEFSPNSRTAYWARSLAFEYVPAVRGRSFFNALKRRLHATLAATVAPKLTKASDAFLAGLRAEVIKIEQESHRLLDLKTEFSLPNDLGDLFEALDFNSSDADNVLTALRYRGDGVQGRHVPLILKFLADQRKKNSAKGRPPSETIWGFEEPENNLELTKQIEASKEFEGYSRDIQIIVSTHSPAFYRSAMTSKAGSIQFAARVGGLTSYATEAISEGVDETLGLMPFVVPYLEKANEEREKVVAALAEVQANGLLTKGNALYVEGPTDKLLVETAAKVLNLKINAEIFVRPQGGGGASWVADQCIARAALIDVQGVTVALWDDDEAGRQAKEHAWQVVKSLNRHGKLKAVFAGVNNAPDHVRRIRASGVKISWAIDELCSDAVWKHAADEGWLETREDELRRLNGGVVPVSQSLLEFVEEKVTRDDDRLIVLHSVRMASKEKFAKLAADLMKFDEVVPDSLAVLARDLHQKFQ